MSTVSYKFLSVAAICCLTSVGNAAVALFDFSTETLEDRFNGYIGGWFGNELDFGQWYGDDADTSISGSNLIVGSSVPDAPRSAVVVLDPAAFAVDGAGDYRLTFDLTAFSMSDSLPLTGNDYAFASVWSGSGYDLSNTTGNALFVSPGLANIVGSGSATASEIARGEYTSAGNGLIVDFAYDGTSAIAIFLGAFQADGWPFPSASFANVGISSLTDTNPIPEPSMFGLILLVTGLALGTRRIHRIRR